MEAKAQGTIFVNYDTELSFTQNGFVILPIDNTKILDGLDDLYRNNSVENNEGLQLSLKSNKPEQKIIIHRLASSLLRDFFSTHLLGYRPLAAGFISKIPGKENSAGLHRDPSFTDESKCRTLLFWCPLVDTDKTNGALGIIPQSNLVFNGYKGMVYGKFDFSPDEKKIQKKYGKLLHLKRGEGVIFDTALLHYSGQNYTTNPRIVFSCFLVPDN